MKHAILCFLLICILTACGAETAAEEQPKVMPTPKATAELVIREVIEPTEISEELATPEKVVRELKTVEPFIVPDPGNETAESEQNVQNPEVKVSESDNEPSLQYYGTCRITFYCPCSQCCGSWGNATASGAMPTAGWTAANGSLPFGTLVEIDGHTYCVEDRGVGSDEFDIFVSDHGEALARGLYYTEVYIVG